MLPIFECAPHIGIFCSTCCWKKFLVSRGLPADLQKYSKNEKFSLKNWKNYFFRSWEVKIDSQGAGKVSDVFLVCHGVLLLTIVDHPRKNLWPGAPPSFPNWALKNVNFRIFSAKKIYFLKSLPTFLTENVAEIFGNMMGTLHPRNIRRRGFMKFHVLFVKL